MPVQTVKKEIIIGKEISEVGDFVGELIADIKAGKDIALIATENLPGLYKAIEGYDQLDDEAKSEYAVDSGLYVASKISSSLLKKEQA